jgi:hypothetical protein
MAKSKEADLEAKLQKAIQDADAFIDAKAAEIAKQNPGVPELVVRQTLCRRGNCPCTYALNLLEEEKVA